jgi:hypothetical protein
MMALSRRRIGILAQQYETPGIAAMHPRG